MKRSLSMKLLAMLLAVTMLVGLVGTSALAFSFDELDGEVAEIPVADVAVEEVDASGVTVELPSVAPAAAPVKADPMNGKLSGTTVTWALTENEDIVYEYKYEVHDGDYTSNRTRFSVEKDVDAFMDSLSSFIGETFTYTGRTPHTGYTLTIGGTGATPAYSYGSSLPWKTWKKQITALEIGTGVTEIGNYVFYELEALPAVTVPGNVKRIGSGAFHRCYGLRDVQLQEGVQEMGSGVFCSYGESAIGNLTIPASMVQMNPFALCCSGAYVTVAPGNTKVNAAGPFVFASDNSKKLVNYTGWGMFTLDTVEVPEGVEIIGECAFGNYSDAPKDYKLPESLRIIENDAFWHCGWVNVKIPDGVTHIGNYAFGEMVYVESIELGKGLETIVSDAFGDDYNLTTLVFQSDPVVLPDEDGNTEMAIDGADTTIIIPKDAVNLLFGLSDGDFPCENVTDSNGDPVIYEGKHPVQVTSLDELRLGDFVVIAASSVNKAMAGLNSSEDFRDDADVYKYRNILEYEDDAKVQLFRLIDNKDGSYSFYDVDKGVYLYAPGGSNHLKEKNYLDDNGKWDITFGSDGTATIKSRTTGAKNTILYNLKDPRFSCYASVTNKVTEPVILYRKAPAAMIVETGVGYMDLQSAINDTVPGQTVKIMSNLKDVEVTVAAGKAVTLDLNGHIVRGKDTAKYMVTVNEGTLTIKDTSAKQNGKIVATSTAKWGAAVYILNGYGALTSGTIEGGEDNYGVVVKWRVDEEHPAAAMMPTDVFVMTGGKITKSVEGLYIEIDVEDDCFEAEFERVCEAGENGTILDDMKVAVTVSGGEICSNKYRGIFTDTDTITLVTGTARICHNGYAAGEKGIYFVGGGMCQENGMFVVNGDAVITGNSANIGGGFEAHAWGAVVGGNALITGNTCIDPRAADGHGWGGGVYANGTDAYVIENAVVCGNKNSSDDSDDDILPRLWEQAVLLCGEKPETQPGILLLFQLSFRQRNLLRPLYPKCSSGATGFGGHQQFGRLRALL